MEQYPVYRTATIRKLKRSHADSNIEIRNINPSRPILRSASVIKTKKVQPNFGHYEAYSDEQPENLVFRRGKFFKSWNKKIWNEKNHFFNHFLEKKIILLENLVFSNKDTKYFI